MARTAVTADRKDWVIWLDGYSAAKFYDAFMQIAQDAESRCIHCHEHIFLDIREGGGIPDWRSQTGDYGCEDSPDTTDDGVGSHVPRKLDS